MSYRSFSVFALAALAAFSSADMEVYMTGLANPRGMSFDTDGTLYVAEAGLGGGTFGKPFSGGGGSATFGLSGGVSSRKGAGVQAKALVGLPSLAGMGGGEATGIADVARTADGRFAAIFGLGAGAAARGTIDLPGSNLLGTLAYYDTATSNWTVAQDYAQREQDDNPDPTEVNSNPYGFVADGGSFAVADGGANVLWRDGGATVLPSQMVPNPFGPGEVSQEAVATSVVARPGGGFYVGELGGFPFSPGKSRIHEIGADGSYLGVKYDLLTSITDMAYASDGSLLVAEIAADGLLAGGPGDVKRIRPDGTVETIIEGLVTPTSVAFHDGHVYVTNDALSPTGGQVLRFDYQPVPEPTAMVALGVGLVGLARRRRK